MLKTPERDATKNFLIKKIICGILLLCPLLFCGCGQYDAAAMLQGNLDVIYLGEYSPEYLQAVDLSADEAEAAYENGLLTSAKSFAHKYDINWELLSEETRERLVDLQREVYRHSKYEVGEAVADGEDYLVELTVQPIDTYSKFLAEDAEGLLADRQQRLDAGELDGMSEQQLEEDWAQSILSLMEQRLDAVGYLPAETITVRIAPDEDGYLTITDSDFARIDGLIIK
ncbi:MAG: hypothetical protein IJB67_04535 [Firmicutes bacterium]|nr:hypothetical protein [Bacillota bacterium]